VDTSNDDANCGACGTPCAGRCVGGVCTSSAATLGTIPTTASDYSVDATNFYWFDSSDNAIHALPLAGGPATVYFSIGYAPGALVADDQAFYWTDHLAGAVRKLVKGSASAAVFAAATQSNPVLAQDAANVYFADGNNVMRADKATGQPAIINSIGSLVGIWIGDTVVFELWGPADNISTYSFAGITIASQGPNYPSTFAVAGDALFTAQNSYGNLCSYAYFTTFDSQLVQTSYPPPPLIFNSSATPFVSATNLYWSTTTLLPGCTWPNGSCKGCPMTETTWRIPRCVGPAETTNKLPAFIASGGHDLYWLDGQNTLNRMAEW